MLLKLSLGSQMKIKKYNKEGGQYSDTAIHSSSG
jgi:hypothetical protein